MFRSILREEYSFKNINSCHFYNCEGENLTEAALILTKDGEIVYIESDADRPFDVLNIMKQYKIEKKLGQGGFGKVYKANHKDTGQTVAIKYIDITDSSKYESNLSNSCE